ncbi:hypothetical protein FOBRF1_001662 [Fusarium oxysporum]
MEDLQTLFGDLEEAQKFYKAQHYFCVIVVGSPGVVTIKADGTRCLPWIDDNDEILGKGAFGDVSKVIIPPGHFTTDGNFGQFNSDPMVVARKSFTGAVKPGKSFRQELQNIQQILRSNSTHNNILTNLAAIVEETNPPNFYLLMPLATMDLENYMKVDRKNQMDMALKASLISSAMGLADGLDFLHNRITDDQGQQQICYHLDMKPANVLLFKDPGPPETGTSNDAEMIADPSESPGSKHEKMIWKLSDFGISKIKIVKKSEKKDLDGLFERKKSQSEENGATATHNGRGLGEFLPPEANSQRREMDEKSDIWSLGCIISVLFAYMEYGSQGVEEYSRVRLEQSKKGVAIFWQPRGPFLLSLVDINKEVSSKHESLITEARRRNAGEAAAISSMLTFLEDRVLKTRKKERCSAREIHDQLGKTLKAYSGEQAVTGSRSNSMVSSRLSSERWVSNYCDLGLKLNSNRDVNVTRWSLDTDKTTEFDGCESSLNGMFFAYWNAKVILYFNHVGTPGDAMAQWGQTDCQRRMPIDRLRQSSTDTSREPTFPSTLAPLDRRKPNNASEAWKTVKLAHNHLVAISTANGTSHCYVFMTTGERNLDRFNKVTLPYEHVHLLSVCRNPETLICLLSDKAGRSFLWRAEIGWIEHESAVQPSSNCANTESSRDDNMSRPDLKGRKTWALEWRASDIIHIILQTHDICYIVVRDHKNPLNLLVNLHYLESNEFVQWCLKLEPLTNTVSRLFDDMECFHKNSGRSEAIMVTHSERIWHFKSEETGAGLTADRHQRDWYVN